MPGRGLEPFVQNLKKFQNHPARENLLIGASLASPDNDLMDFISMAQACAPYVDYFTLNASCPNVAHGIITGRNAVAKAAEQITVCRKSAENKPVFLKLGPTSDEEILSRMTEAAVDAGASGFVATNTLTYPDRDFAAGLDFEWPHRDGQAVGGYSGPALLPIACWMVRKIRACFGKNMPIIGVGGVQSGADAVALMRAGANAVQIYTGLTYHGPALIREILAAQAIYQAAPT